MRTNSINTNRSWYNSGEIPMKEDLYQFVKENKALLLLTLLVLFLFIGAKSVHAYSLVDNNINLWWFNDTYSGTENVVDYGALNDTANASGDANVNNFSACHANFTNCGYTDGFSDYFRATGPQFEDAKNYTWFCMFRPAGTESNFDMYCGDNDAFYININSGNLQLNLRDSLGFDNIVVVSGYNATNTTWYFLWGWNNQTHYCAYLDNGSLVGCSTWNANFQTPDKFEFGGRDASTYVSSYFQAGAIWNFSLNTSQMDCVYDLVISGSRNFSTCDVNGSSPSASSPPGFLYYPKGGLLNTTAEYFSFKANETVNYTLEYGINLSYGTNLTGNGSALYDFNITGLSPGTTYYYNLTIINNQSNSTYYNGSFDVMPSSLNSFKFGFVGDAHFPLTAGARKTAMNDAINTFKTQGVDFLVFGGDSYEGDTEEQAYNNTYSMSEYLANQNFNIPIIGIAGNHDPSNNINNRYIVASEFWINPTNGVGTHFGASNVTEMVWALNYSYGCFVGRNEYLDTGFDDTMDVFLNSSLSSCNSSQWFRTIFTHEPYDESADYADVYTMMNDYNTTAFSGHIHSAGYNQTEGLGFYRISSVSTTPHTTLWVGDEWSDYNNTYHYGIVSVNASHAQIDFYNGSDVIIKTVLVENPLYAADTTPPIISNISNSTTNTTITINWTTDEGATTQIEYGVYPTIDTGTGTGGYWTNHTWTLTSLTPNTTYVINITSCDASSNCATEGTFQITTDANPIPQQPTVYNAYPSNNSILNQTWINISGYFIDLDNATETLKRYINGSLNATNSTALNNTLWTENITLGYGTYYYNFEASDGDYSVNSSTYYFTLQCVANWQNTSYSAYTNTSCSGGYYNYSRYLTQYDLNSCPSSTNTTFWDNGTTACAEGVYFSSYNIEDTLLSDVDYYLNGTLAVVTDNLIIHVRDHNSTIHTSNLPSGYSIHRTLTNGTDFNNTQNITSFSFLISEDVSGTTNYQVEEEYYNGSIGIYTSGGTISQYPTYTKVEIIPEYYQGLKNIVIYVYQSGDGSSPPVYSKDINFTYEYLPPFIPETYTNYSVKAVKTGYYNKTESKTISSNGVYNITNMYQTILYITAEEAVSGASITNFSGTILDVDRDVETNISTLTGTITVYAMNDTNYSITINQEEAFASFNTTQWLVTDETPENVLFVLYSFNSVLFTFKDETTKTILNETTVYLDIISDVFSTNYTSSNGTVYATLLEPSSYNARITASGYHDREYYFVVTNDSTQQITIYMLNNTIGTNVSIEIIDQSGKAVPGAIVKALKRDIPDDEYIQVEAGKTNYEGKTILKLSLYDTYYKFIIEYEDVVVKIIPATTLTSDEIRFQVTIGDEPTATYDTYNGVTGSWTRNSGTITFTYASSDSQDVEICVDIKEFGRTGEELLSSECLVSAGGMINQTIILNNNTEYEAFAYIVSSSPSGQETISSLPFSTDETEPDDGSVGLQVLLSLLIIIFFVFAAPEFVISGLGLSLLVGRVLNLTNLSPYVIVPVIIIGGLIGWIIKDKYR